MHVKNIDFNDIDFGFMEKHFEETKDAPDAVFGIDREFYERNQDSIKIFGLYDGVKLIGYMSYFLFFNHHEDNVLSANQDAIYVIPEYRNQGASRYLVEQVDQLLNQEFGVKIFYQHCKKNSAFRYALGKINYKEIETIFIKRF